MGCLGGKKKVKEDGEKAGGWSFLSPPLPSFRRESRWSSSREVIAESEWRGRRNWATALLGVELLIIPKRRGLATFGTVF